MVVFKILNKVSGQHYVGSCRGDIFERWQLYLQAADAGLDFPLYQEIRELGEAKFSIDELDYAEDIGELKEMELLHTVELGARSLRSYKFGLNENVVKRRRQIQHENAWKKEIPADAQPSSTAHTTTKPVIKPTIKPEAVQTGSATLNPSKTTIKPAVKAAAATSIAIKTSTPQITVKPTTASQATVTTTDTSPTSVVTATATHTDQPADIDAPSELDKSLFAESIGLLVQTLSSVEQLTEQQRQAKQETVALAQALTASDQALQQLQQQHDEAAVKALAAMAAVEASQQANQALIAAQQQARSCSVSALKALEQSDATAAQAGQLQHQLTQLLGRLKAGSTGQRSNPRAATTPTSSTTVNSQPHSTPSTVTRTFTASSQQTVEQPVIAKPIAQNVTDLPASEPNSPLETTASTLTATAAEQQLVAAEEAKMVNQLKQLDRLLDQPVAQPPIVGTDVEKSEAVAIPARAWVAGAESNAGADSDRAQLLPKEPATPTVIRRRSRTAKRIMAATNSAAPSLANSAHRPTVSRKRLSIKAQR